MVVAKGKNEKYVTEIYDGNKKIYSDITREKGGSGKGIRPHELIEAGFASCLNISTRMILDTMNIKFEEVIVKVRLDRDNQDKTIFKYKIDIQGEIDDGTKDIVMEKVKNCPVKETLSKQLEFLNDTTIL